MNASPTKLFNPFPGLRPFEADENHLFFGRDGQSDELITRLRRNRFVAVVGTSGSGKSSLVRSGLLPGLHGGLMSKAGSRWRIAIMRPGYRPIGNLAQELSAPAILGRADDDVLLRSTLIETTLRRGSIGLIEAVTEARLPQRDNLLLVVDQFEEIFRFKQAHHLAESENEAAAFVKLFLEAARQDRMRIFVVLTMRSDYLGDCAQFPSLPEAINDGQYLIPRMTREQRRQAITGPVAVGGGKIAARLVNRLLNDVGDNPDQLPILQHALMRTWDFWAAQRQHHEPLDLQHYEAIGGMAQALSLHADEAYNELEDERSRLICEKLFKALTEKGEDNREIRRPSILGDVCELSEANASEVGAVIDTFRQPGRTFLMPPAAVQLRNDTLIDISHESLIRNWARLKTWVEEEAQSAQIYRRLAETAALHAGGRAGLWRDPDLHLALDWQKRHRPNVTWARRYDPHFDAAIGFLKSSEKSRDAEIAAKEAARQRELEQAQALADEQRKRAEAERAKAEEQKKAAARLRRRAVALFFVMVAALAAAGIAIFLYGLANTQKERAVAAKLEADSARAETQRALAAEEKARAQADSARKVAVRQREIADKLRLQAVGLQQLAEDRARVAEQAKRLAVEQRDRADSLAGVAQQNYERAEEHRLEAERLRRLSTALLLAAQSSLVPNDTLAVLVARSAYFLNLRNGGTHDNEIYEALRQALMRPSFEPDGGPIESRRHGDWGEAVAFSPDGNWIASGSADSSVVLWNLGQSNRGTIALSGHQASVNSVAFSHIGTWLASGSDDHTVLLWDWERRGKPLRTLTDNHDRVWTVAFSPNRRYLASGSADGTVMLWNLETGNESRKLGTHQGSVRAVAFSPTGSLLASAGADAAVKLWNVQSSNGAEPQTLTQEGRVRGVAFSADGRYLATAGEDAIVRLWDLQRANAEPRRLRGHEGPVNHVAFSPTRAILASASADRTARLWDLDRAVSGPKITLEHAAWVWSVAFSPDGKRLATASSDKIIRLWVSSSEDLVDISLARVKRNLTSKEWQGVVGKEIPFEPAQIQPKK